MREQIFLDTSAIYALINKNDPDHLKVKKFVGSFRGTFFITNYIFDESISLINARLGHSTAIYAGDILLKSTQIEKVWIAPKDEKDAWHLFISRGDKGYSFTDCSSFVVMKRLGILKYLSFDVHFRQEGFTGIL